MAADEGSTQLLLVGGGQMGGALLAGLLAAGREPSTLAVVEPAADQRRVLAERHPGVRVLEVPDADAVGTTGGALLAVKPEVAEPVCRLLGSLGVPRVLSVVAGLPAQRLEAALGAGRIVVRAMPNTPALIGAGATAMSGGSHARAEDLDWAEAILSAVGTVVRLPERLLDAVTGLSGSGPAYVFLIAEALIEAGVLAGLPRQVSRSLTIETLLGSARMLADTGDEPEALRAAVTSPGGTTATGLRALEARAVRSAFLEAVLAAAERSRNLAR